MTTFRQHLATLIAQPPPATEDVLARVLPVFRTALALHNNGQVAPLDRLEAVVWIGDHFELTAPTEVMPQANWAMIERVEATLDSAIEVLPPVTELVLADEALKIERPVFVTHYRAWEHCLDHHDQLSDVFLLGLLLGSVALAMDLGEEAGLRRFASHRHNLFELRPDLHPVLARAIRLMTEPHRRRRAGNLTNIIESLENYRDGRLELEFELDRIEGFHAKDLVTKEQIILAKLQQRLFDASRRNRLLHFRPTGGSLNVTMASTPLSEDPAKIRADRVLIWNDEFQHHIASGKPLRLNKLFNFNEVLYLPSTLERIRSETRRDMTEYGFAQLRLAACFLSWTNLKEQPPERFDSPLVLVPVQLIKEKGVADAYVLSATSDEAEVNPALRRVFRQLYAIDLPETIDLSVASLKSLYEFLRDRVRQSNAAVQVELVEQPIIEDLRRQARKRLEQYRRRAGIDDQASDGGAQPSTAGTDETDAAAVTRTDTGADDAATAAVADTPASATALASGPPPAALNASETPGPIAPTETAPAETAPAETAADAGADEPSRYRLVEAHRDNPFIWTFNLCNVTLANFRYHKMSLVRDYDSLIGEQRMSEAFAGVFRLTPRTPAQVQSGLPLEQRFDVLMADPTQAAAVARARAGETYIIQGPPGTGKSQTISNLIADYAARGCRVLFVCEKRAAIDVVYSRLSQRGLADLCCLIHDSQADKKAFVMELKRTYEEFLAESKSKANRDRATTALASAIAPLVDIERVLQTSIGSHNLTIRKLLIRLVELRKPLEQLPANLIHHATYEHWLKAEDVLRKLAQTLVDVQPDGIYANHPLRLIVSNLTPGRERTQQITLAVQNARAAAARLTAAFEAAEAPQEFFSSTSLAALLTWLEKLIPFTATSTLELLLADSSLTAELEAAKTQLAAKQQAVEQAQQHTTHWKKKLTPDETGTALKWAETYEQDMFRWVKPRWWQLRRAVQGGYDFGAHAIQPTWIQVLQRLQAEHAAVADYRQVEQQIAARFGFSGDFATWYQQLAGLRSDLQALPDGTAAWARSLINNRSATQLKTLAEAAAQYRSMNAETQGIIDTLDKYSLTELAPELSRLEQSLGLLPAFEPCLHLLANVPGELADFIRRQHCTLQHVEAAAAQHSLELIYREYPELRRWDTELRVQCVLAVESAHAKWLEENCSATRLAVRNRFAERVQLSTAATAQLDESQKQWKKQYTQGRRDLEREFGKSMRFRSIRDLIGGPTGDVIRDMKPVWLMSPLSVADSLPLDPRQFDVVIFDEASQITLEEAVPTLCRAPQAIIVGDEMQLPPTSFFARRDEDELEVQWEEQGETQAYDLASESLLNHGARHLPSTMLGWHYRSRNELLIAFSNAAFYGGRLLTVPEEELVSLPRTPLRITAAQQGQQNADEALRRPISFHRLTNGVYEKRRNRGEAEYIANLLRALLTRENRLTIGIVAFSEAQQEEIEQALYRLAAEDTEFRERLDAEFERMEDNQFVGLLVKNLENIQGDERDIVILSVCYGPDAAGTLRMHFGPINISGGEKRLNVAFTRAKQHMIVVSSMDGEMITNDYNAGARCLKNYLRYAAAVSAGSGEIVDRVLQELMPLKAAGESVANNASYPPALQLAEALRQRGWIVDAQVGHSHFQCDLAVRAKEDTNYRLAILFDHEILPPHGYDGQVDDRAVVLEKSVLRPKLLESFGWRVEHVLLRQWRDAPEKIVERVLEALAATQEADNRQST